MSNKNLLIKTGLKYGKICSNNCVLFVSLSFNNRYWNKNKLKIMFNDLDLLPCTNKIIILNKKHTDINKWIDKYKYIIPSHFKIDCIFINNDEIDTNTKFIIVNKIGIRNDLSISKSDQINHIIESYLLTEKVIKKYDSDYLLYYGAFGNQFKTYYSCSTLKQ